MICTYAFLILQPNATGGGQNPPLPGPAPVFGSPTHIPHGITGPLTPGTYIHVCTYVCA